MKLLRIIIIVLILLIFGGFCFIALKNDPQSILHELLENHNNDLIWIILTILGLILVSTLTGLPVLYFSIALGFFMNYLPSLLISWSFNLLAILITFLMVRKVFSSYFMNRYGNRKIIRNINVRIRKYGFWTVAMSRGMYVIPTNIINFSFPLSKIPTKQYLLGTMIGLLPESLINVTTGYLLKHQLLLLDSPRQNLLKILIIGIFLFLMSAGILFINYRRKKVKKARMNEIVPPLQDN